MPIEPASLPAATLETVRDALAATGRFPRRRGGNVSLSVPHEVFAADLESLAQGRPLTEAAKSVGWRVLVEDDGAVAAAAEATSSGTAVNRGPFVHATVEAIRMLEDHQRVASERFELRLLHVHALYLVALWLQGEGALFVPLAPSPPPLKAVTTYDGEEFERELQQLARSVAEAYRAADRSDELGG